MMSKLAVVCKLLLAVVMVMFTIFGIPILIALPFLLSGFLGQH